METTSVWCKFPDLEKMIFSVWWKMSPFVFRCNCQPKVGALCEERSWRTGKCRHHQYWHSKVWTAGLLYKWMEKGKKCKAVWDTVDSDRAAHITPQVSIAISIRNVASYTKANLPLTVNVFEVEVKVSYIKTRKKSWCSRIQVLPEQFWPKNNNDDWVPSPPNTQVTFRNLTVCKYTVYKSDNLQVHFRGHVLDLQKCKALLEV